MFLFWLFVAIAFGIAEEIHDSVDAYLHPYELPDCFKKHEYHSKTVEDYFNNKK